MDGTTFVRLVLTEASASHDGHHLHLRGEVAECSCGESLGAAGATLASGQVCCDACGAAGVGRLVRSPGSRNLSVSWAE